MIIKAVKKHKLENYSSAKEDLYIFREWPHSLHFDVCVPCFSYDLAMGAFLPPPHSTCAALRWLRSPPLPKHGKYEGTPPMTFRERGHPLNKYEDLAFWLSKPTDERAAKEKL
jgi:hypothetical protein